MSAAEAVAEAGPVASPNPCEPVLERLRSEAAMHFGAPDARLSPTEFKERVFSYVLRASVSRDGQEPSSHVYIKVFKLRPRTSAEKIREHVLRDFETTRRIHHAMAGWDDLGAVRAIACYPEHLAIVTEETRGHTLGALLQERARWFPKSATRRHLADTMATVGRWVRAFQAIDPRDDRISLDELLSYIDLRLNRLVGESPSFFTEADRTRVLKHLERLMSRVPPSDLTDVLVHADLAPGNILVAGRRVVALDFATTHRGSALQDISRLYVQLDLMCAKPQFRPSVIRVLQAGLLRGFDPGLTEVRPLFRIMLLRHHVNHLLTLVVRREKFPAAVYNAHLRRVHRRWIAAEVSATSGEGR